MTGYSRRSALAVLALGVTGAGLAFPAAATSGQVFRSPSCTCCRAWIEHMARAGYRLESVIADDLAAVRRRLGVPDALAACHTAVVSGFAIEGHVPASDVTSLLARRPTGAAGLAVPGMPLGSPGMETPNDDREAYATLLILSAGRTRTFAQH